MFFISKKDTVYTLIIWGAIAGAFLTMVLTIFSALTILNFLAFTLALIIVGWLVWIWFSTGYLIENDTLIMKGGPFKQTVDIQAIKKITKEKSAVTSTALAMDRILVHYGNNKYVSISPKQEKALIQLLLRKNPNIQLDNTLSELYKD